MSHPLHKTKVKMEPVAGTLEHQPPTHKDTEKQDSLLQVAQLMLEGGKGSLLNTTPGNHQLIVKG